MATNPTAAPNPADPVTARRWILGLLAGFALVVAANIGFLIVALQNPISVEQSYLDEAR